MTVGYLAHAEGSVLIEMGATKVLCTASGGGVPPFLRNTGNGWLTAEYAMLPMAGTTRTPRESSRGKVGGRTHEIQRLIGRSLRAVTDLDAFGERTIYIDCDVIQADGGTRTASITGSFVALVELFRKMKERGLVDRIPVEDSVAAVSVGVRGGEILLDLDYSEDSGADVDMNVVMTGSGRFIEVQGTAEESPFGGSISGPHAGGGLRRHPGARRRAAGRPRRSPLKTVVFASRNRGKIREIRALLEGLPISLRSLDDFPDARTWRKMAIPSGRTRRKRPRHRPPYRMRSPGRRFRPDSGRPRRRPGGPLGPVCRGECRRCKEHRQAAPGDEGHSEGEKKRRLPLRPRPL